MMMEGYMYILIVSYMYSLTDRKVCVVKPDGEQLRLNQKQWLDLMKLA